MPLKEWLFTNMTIRNMLTDFGFRNEFSRSKKFTEYFAFRLGKYQRGDFWLYFPEQPFWEQYRNEAFNKLRELDISSVPKYFDFHFGLFPDKSDFLLFINNELKDRLAKLKSPRKRIKLETALEWTTQKETEVRTNVNEAQDRLILAIQQTLAEERNNVQPDFQKIVEEIKTMISVRQVDYTEAEERLTDALHALPSGKIELNNPLLEKRLIEFFVHLSNVQPSYKKGDVGLFKTFAQADITSVLKTHFVAFKSLKYSTVQKNVGEVVNSINWKNPSILKLNDALQDFFYG